MTDRHITIGVLVGGQSRRMGTHKALLPVGDETLLQRTIRVSSATHHRVVLVGEAPFELPGALAELIRIADRPSGIGPLGALSGLLQAADGDVVLLACDMPAMEVALIDWLIAESARHPNADIIAPVTTDAAAPHTCCALYRQSVLPLMNDQIARGAHALKDLMTAATAHVVAVPDALQHCLANVNTPQDWQHQKKQRANH